MRISDILNARGDAPLISCEFFPPKTDAGETRLWQTLEALAAIDPDFVSVTYGAGGSTRDRTRRIVLRIARETKLPPVAHLTCTGSTREELAALLDDYRAHGIENILALRGDPPEGAERFEAAPGGFAHATDLIAFIRERGDFCIGCATYPEGHPESPNGADDDIRWLKVKQDLGADYAITQYFFDNDAYFRFMDKAAAAGVTIPVIPGIMPVGNYDQIVRFSAMCGANVPDWLHERMAPVREDAEATFRLGVEIATAQCRELIARGAPGLHFYTLNKPDATLAIVRDLHPAD